MSSRCEKIPGTEKLVESKFRLTPQRKSVLLVLYGSKEEEHLTAEEIYRIAKNNCPQLGLATVYRTLELFSRLSIVQSLVLEDGRIRYELKRDGRHNHLICLSCGKILESDSRNVTPPSHGKTNFLVVSSSTRFFGYCEQCRDNK